MTNLIKYYCTKHSNKVEEDSPNVFKHEGSDCTVQELLAELEMPWATVKESTADGATVLEKTSSLKNYGNTKESPLLLECKRFFLINSSVESRGRSHLHNHSCY